MKKLLLSIFSLLTLSGGIANACTADFSYYISSMTPPIVNFSDSSANVALPVAYSWDFGDGTFGTLANEVHTFPSTGSYQVCLHITDNLGCVDSICYQVNIVPPAPSVSAYLIVDSMNMYNCTSPASVGFYYFGNIQGYSPPDSILFDINFGDGVDSTFYLGVGSGQLSGSLTHSYLNGGNYNPQLIVTAPNNVADTAVSLSVIVASSCGTISGIVYNDINGNCTYDAGEELQNISVLLYNGTNLMGWTQSDVSGVYSFNVPTGSTYDIQVNASGGYIGHYVPSCPASGTITVSTIPSAGNDFGVTCPPGFDLTGNVTGWGFRPGFIASVCVFAYNQRCNTPSGQIDLVFPAGLTPLPDSNGTGYTINGNTVTYLINGPALYWQFCIPVSVSSSLLIGDTVCIDMNILPVVGDSVPSDNSGSFCFLVRNSWDPNDKYTNEGQGVQGSVMPNTSLTYTIRFQNTGNADAINIYILDTLNANLDASSVEFIGSSHPATMSLLTGNILRFNLDNINLPDMTTNEPASHGYVSYRINQLNNLAQLTPITNTAGIYFDFNPPIITNTTLNTVDNTLSVPVIQDHSSLVNVYPNPANGKCYLFFSDNHQRTISVTDLLGKEVFRSIALSNSFLLNTEKFAEGIFSIRINDDKNQTDTSKLIIVH